MVLVGACHWSAFAADFLSMLEVSPLSLPPRMSLVSTSCLPDTERHLLARFMVRATGITDIEIFISNSGNTKGSIVKIHGLHL